MGEQKLKDVDHEKREQARRRLSTEFERLQDSLKPVSDAFTKVKQAKFDDDMAELLGTLNANLNRAIRGGFFRGGVQGHVQARDEWLKVKGKDDKTK